MAKPNVYIIAGPNGAGKITFARQLITSGQSDSIEIFEKDLFQNIAGNGIHGD